MKKKGQPTHKKGAKYGYQNFEVQEPADPRPGPAEEQKEWPLCNTPTPAMPEPAAAPKDQPPQSAPSAE